MCKLNPQSIVGILKEIFLSKKEKQIVEIYNLISSYWKNTNDFVVAHIRYLQDLNHKYKLGFDEELISSLPYVFLTPLIQNGLSQSNSIYIFSQFVGLYIFRNDNPLIYRYSNENLFNIAENINKLLIPYNSKLYPELEYQINKDIDVPNLLGNRNLKKSDNMRNERDRFQSKTILAIKVGCSVQNLKEKVFEQFDSLDVPVDEFKNLITKHTLTKSEHALKYKMHPDDTPAAIMIEMLEEYIILLKSRKKTDNQIFREMATDNPDIMTQIISALATGDMQLYNDLMTKNPEFLDKFIEKMADNEDKDI